MGNGFGHIPTNSISRFTNPDITPEPYKKPTFDPNYGFEQGRPERKMIATPEQMISAKLNLHERDYCAHLLLKYRACRKDVWPLAAKCHHEQHAYLNCQYEDFVLRMKEYERERRLLVRQKKMKELEEEEEE